MLDIPKVVLSGSVLKYLEEAKERGHETNSHGRMPMWRSQVRSERRTVLRDLLPLQRLPNGTWRTGLNRGGNNIVLFSGFEDFETSSRRLRAVSRHCRRLAALAESTVAWLGDAT
jgi:hypothetical protein